MNQNKEDRFFKIAKNASLCSTFKGPRLGAVITYKNKILVTGWNTEKEIPMQKYYNKYRDFDPNRYKNCAHAEMNAINKLIRVYNIRDIDIDRCSIFIYRCHKSGKNALAKPCKACEVALRKIGIKNIYYTGENSIINEIYK